MKAWGRGKALVPAFATCLRVKVLAHAYPRLCLGERDLHADRRDLFGGHLPSMLLRLVEVARPIIRLKIL